MVGICAYSARSTMRLCKECKCQCQEEDVGARTRNDDRVESPQRLVCGTDERIHLLRRSPQHTTLTVHIEPIGLITVRRSALDRALCIWLQTMAADE